MDLSVSTMGHVTATSVPVHLDSVGFTVNRKTVSDVWGAETCCSQHYTHNKHMRTHTLTDMSVFGMCALALYVGLVECLNGGQCHEDRCVCPSRWKGERCQIRTTDTLPPVIRRKPTDRGTYIRTYMHIVQSEFQSVGAVVLCRCCVNIKQCTAG